LTLSAVSDSSAVSLPEDCVLEGGGSDMNEPTSSPVDSPTASPTSGATGNSMFVGLVSLPLATLLLAFA